MRRILPRATLDGFPHVLQIAHDARPHLPAAERVSKPGSEAGEQVAGRPVDVDDHRALLDRDEPHTRTMRDDPNTRVDESGRYWLHVPAGEHHGREVVPVHEVVRDGERLSLYATLERRGPASESSGDSPHGDPHAQATTQPTSDASWACDMPSA